MRDFLDLENTFIRLFTFFAPFFQVSKQFLYSIWSTVFLTKICFFLDWENNSILHHLEENIEESMSKYQNLMLEIKLEFDEVQSRNRETAEFGAYFNRVFDRMFSC